MGLTRDARVASREGEGRCRGGWGVRGRVDGWGGGGRRGGWLGESGVRRGGRRGCHGVRNFSKRRNRCVTSNATCTGPGRGDSSMGSTWPTMRRGRRLNVDVCRGECFTSRGARDCECWNVSSGAAAKEVVGDEVGDDRCGWGLGRGEERGKAEEVSSKGCVCKVVAIQSRLYPIL